ncbi:hypothetical protein IFM89_030765 [Coptis chinensis]|uniref:Uncharacterized protein n=1 Tax=Coptis chinensis TaxID=261450 RepID=A0A835HZ42_9MAGN|nr:hypothetical protein IFM89_030765 [Coptis chinensis]
MVTLVRSGILRKPNETMRLLVTTIVGVVFGFLVGVSVPTVSLTKFHFPSNLIPSINFTYMADTWSSVTGGSSSSSTKVRNWNNEPTIWVPTNPRERKDYHRALLQLSQISISADCGVSLVRHLQDLTIKPKYLVTFTVGLNQKSNIDAAVKKFSENFTILLFHYDGRTSEWDEFEWSKRAIHVTVRKQTKWWYAKRFLHPDIVAPYDYIFIWDEDLGTENFDAEEYIKLVRKHGLEISQPGLEPNSGLTWQMTKKRYNNEVHKETEERPGWCTDPHLPPCAAYGNALQFCFIFCSFNFLSTLYKCNIICRFVEIMATVFSRDAWRCVWYMIQNDLVHGWGLDFALRKCVEPAHEKIGVVDAQSVVHQTVPSLGNQGEAQDGRAPWEGVRERCRKEWAMFQERMEIAEKAYYKELE